MQKLPPRLVIIDPSTGGTTMTPSVQPANLPPQRATLQQTPQDKYGLSCQQYSEKSVVVRCAQLKQYKSEVDADMQRMNGKFNERLKGGPGWIFPLFCLDRIKNYLATGSYYLPRGTKPNDNTAQAQTKAIQLPNVEEITAFFTQPYDQVYPGMSVQQMVVNCRNPTIASLVNIFTANRTYYGIEVMAALNMGTVPDRTKLTKWWQSGQMQGNTVMYTLFGPINQVANEITQVKQNYPWAFINTLANGEIVCVSHSLLEPISRHADDSDTDDNPTHPDDD